MPEKNLKVKLGLKNLAKLSSYFDYMFVHLIQKVRLRPELCRKFLSNLGPNPTRKARPDLQLWCEIVLLSASFAFSRKKQCDMQTRHYHFKTARYGLRIDLIFSINIKTDYARIPTLKVLTLLICNSKWNYTWVERFKLPQFFDILSFK